MKDELLEIFDVFFQTAELISVTSYFDNDDARSQNFSVKTKFDRLVNIYCDKIQKSLLDDQYHIVIDKSELNEIEGFFRGNDFAEILKIDVREKILSNILVIYQVIDFLNLNLLKRIDIANKTEISRKISILRNDFLYS